MSRSLQSFKPIQKPHPPIYIGRYGPRMRRLIGAEGDGWIPWIHAPEVYEKDLKLIFESARRSGREMEEIDTAAIIPTVVLSDREKALEIAARARPPNDLGKMSLSSCS